MRKNIIVIILINIVLFANLFADGLEGTIKDHGSQLPISGAIVWLEGTNYIDTTDANGFFSIVDVPVGTYNVIIDHINYKQKVFPDLLIDKTVGIDDDAVKIPDKFYLEQNYPNPFNPSTNISFQLPQSVHVNLRIYNSLGKLITELVDNWKQAGSYNIIWNATDLNGNLVPSGIYFYQITAGKFTYSKKMILMK